MVDDESSYRLNSKEEDINQRERSLIVGGSIVPETNNEYPGFTWTGIGSGGWGCGGSLIHPDIVLSAAHCQYAVQEINGVYIGPKHIDGSDASKHFQVANITAHPDFDGETMRNDLMLIKLNGKSSVKPIQWNTDPNIPVKGDSVEVIGFGITAEDGGELSDDLRRVHVTVTNKTECSNVWQKERGIKINKSQKICAGTKQGGKDACDSDSGSPLFFMAGGGSDELIQVGIVSDGIGCGRPGKPALYTRISSFTDWIEENICNLSDYPPKYCPPPSHDDKKKEESSSSSTGKTNLESVDYSSTAEQQQQNTVSSSTMGGNWLLFVPIALVVGVAFIVLHRRRRHRHHRNGYNTIDDNNNMQLVV